MAEDKEKEKREYLLEEYNPSGMAKPQLMDFKDHRSVRNEKMLMFSFDTFLQGADQRRDGGDSCEAGEDQEAGGEGGGVPEAGQDRPGGGGEGQGPLQGVLQDPDTQQPRGT